MINLIKSFFAPTVKESESTFYLADKIIKLEEKVAELERENRELNDLILEIETSLKSQIDKIHPVIYNFQENNKST